MLLCNRQETDHRCKTFLCRKRSPESPAQEGQGNRGGDPAENAAITRAILDGEKGYRRNAVLLNAGAAIYISGKAASLAEGVKLAAEAIDSGAAKAKLEEFAAKTNAAA